MNAYLEILYHTFGFVAATFLALTLLAEIELYLFRRFGIARAFSIAFLTWPLTAVGFICIPGEEVYTPGSKLIWIIVLAIFFLYPGLPVFISVIVSNLFKNLTLRHALLALLCLLISLQAPIWLLTMSCAVFYQCL